MELGLSNPRILKKKYLYLIYGIPQITFSLVKVVLGNVCTNLKLIG
jgi:hypothetical protein